MDRLNAFAAIAIILGAPLAFADGTLIGDGGDVIHCQCPAGESCTFDGYYFLDYVATFDEVAGTAALHDGADPLATITTLLLEKFPALGLDLQDFVRNAREQLRNGPDRSQRFIWVSQSNGVTVIDDEELRMLPEEFPAYCYEPDSLPGQHRLKLHQVIIHQDRGAARWFKYDRNYMDLIRGRRLQESFMLVHEWLWDFTDSATVVRDANRFLHEKALARTNRITIRDILRNIGLDLSSIRPQEFTIHLDGDRGNADPVELFFDPSIGIHITFNNANDGFYRLNTLGSSPLQGFGYMRPDRLGGPTQVSELFREEATITVAECDEDQRSCSDPYLAIRLRTID